MSIRNKLATNYPVDLHCHTTRSDGSQTPLELLKHASDLGMSIIAITDHDIRPPVRIEGLDAVTLARDFHVHLINGIEISCDTEVEECHIVCFGCDWDDPYFDELEHEVARSKIDNYRILVNRLSEAGYDVGWDEVLDNAGNRVTEEAVQKKMVFELLARKAYFSSWSDAKEFVKQSPELSIARWKPDPVETIGRIRALGGLTVLAHPYLIAEELQAGGRLMNRDAYIRRLIDAGLDGVEARYTYSKTSYTGSMTEREIADQVYSRYGSLVRFISGGSDYHADSLKGVKNPREMGERGLTEEEFFGNEFLKELIEHTMTR